jgi:hypothetical protein
MSDARIWQPSLESINKGVAFRFGAVYPPKASSVPEKFVTTQRLQMPIRDVVYSLLYECQAYLGFKGRMPRLVNKKTISEVWIPGRSRVMEPNTRLDGHQFGIAIDLMVSSVDPWQKIAEICENLMSRPETGVQRIIFGNRHFGLDFPPGDYRRFREYNGKSDHNDHAHIEVNPDHCKLTAKLRKDVL